MPKPSGVSGDVALSITTYRGDRFIGILRQIPRWTPRRVRCGHRRGPSLSAGLGTHPRRGGGICRTEDQCDRRDSGLGRRRRRMDAATGRRRVGGTSARSAAAHPGLRRAAGRIPAADAGLRRAAPRRARSGGRGRLTRAAARPRGRALTIRPMTAVPETAATQRFVSNGDVRIAIYEQGNPDGPVVVMVHGWPDSHVLWDGVVPLLADRFRVITYDNRGVGPSSSPKQYTEYTMARLAGDFAALVDAVSPDRPVHVLAHDWGSVSVWEYLACPAATNRVASFTSVSGPGQAHLVAA